MNTLTLHKYNAGDFTLVQNRFLDEYMVSANGEFVKIYLYLLRCSSADRELTLASIADTFNHTESDVKRALAYWERLQLLKLSYSEDGALTDIVLTDGVLAGSEQKNRLNTYASRMSDLQNRTLSEPKRISISADRKKELAAQEDIRELIYIAEQYLGKKLSSTEVTNILYFYDELHFSVDLIEYLIEYCVSKGKRSINYIRTVALEWAARDIKTVAEAKKDTNLYTKDYYAVLNAFGIKDRGPAQDEAEHMSRWFRQFGFSLEIVLEACRRTIRRTHTPSFQYADKILESWKNSGFTQLSQIAEADRLALEKNEKQNKAENCRPAKNTVSAPNKFNNFAQRNYDYEQLEQQLLD
ncbi:MAG: DnaD domain protein [Eubacteriales bacterium]|nr:DnaD domain protein [Eubacteriales bacterium]